MIIYSLSLVWYNDWLMKFWWEMDILNPESFANYYYLCNKLILMVIDIFLSHGRLMLCNLCPERSGFPKVRLRCWEHYEVLCISHHIPCKNPPMYSIHIYTVYIYMLQYVLTAVSTALKFHTPNATSVRRRPVTLCRSEVSVAFVSLLRGSFDHVVPCAVSPDGMCHLPDPGTAL